MENKCFYTRLFLVCSLILVFSCASFAQTDIDWEFFLATNTLELGDSPFRILVTEDHPEETPHVILIPDSVTITVEAGVVINFEDEGDEAIYKLIFEDGAILNCTGTDEDHIIINASWDELIYWDHTADYDQDDDPYTDPLYRQLEFQSGSELSMSYTDICRFGTGIFIDAGVTSAAISNCQFDRNYIAIEDRGTGTEISDCDFSGFLGNDWDNGIYQIGIKCFEATNFYYHDNLFDGWISRNGAGGGDNVRDVANRARVSFIELTDIVYDEDHDDNNNLIEEVTFRNPDVVLSCAVRMFDSSPTFYNCLFNDNFGFETFSIGIWNHDSIGDDDEPLISECLFNGGATVLLTGVDDQLNETTIQDCIFQNLQADEDHVAINIRNDSYPNIYRNQFIDCESGIFVNGFFDDQISLANANIENNIFTRDDIGDRALEGVRVRTNTNVRITNNIFANLGESDEGEFVTQCTGVNFWENGIVFAGNSTIMENNIFYDVDNDGTDFGVVAPDADGFTSGYNLFWQIEDAFSGVGEAESDSVSDNDANNPDFVNDPFGLDYAFYLDQTSPCIDDGDPDADFYDRNHTINDRGIFGGENAEPDMNRYYFGTIPANATLDVVNSIVEEDYTLTVEDIIFTIDEDFTVDGTLEIEDGATINFNGNEDLIVDGTMNIPDDASVTIDGSYTFDGTGDIVFGDNVDITFDDAGEFSGDLSITVGDDATLTFESDVEFSGDLTITAGDDTEFVAEGDIEVSGELSIETDTATDDVRFSFSENCELEVSGDLNVTGNADHLVIFSIPDGGLEDWDGINITGGADSDIVYAEISESVGTGILIDNTQVDLISSCEIHDNGTFGILVIDGSVASTNISSCEIYDNGTHGIYLFEEESATKIVNISFCEIYGNDEYGLIVSDHGFVSLMNEYYSNERGGISITGSNTNNIIEGDDIHNNSADAQGTAGVYCFNAIPYFEDTFIRNNFKEGLICDGTTTANLETDGGNAIKCNGKDGAAGRLEDIEEIWMANFADVDIFWGHNDIYDTIFVDPGDDIIMTRVGPDMGTIAGQGNYWEAAALDMDRFSPWGLVNTAQNDPNANTLADFDDWFAGQNEYTQALDYYSNSEFEEAYEVFSEIVEEYPNSRVAANSYARMLNCAIEMEMNLESFGSFIDNIEIDEDVEFVISKRNHASNMVLVELEEFDEAIENFTSQFENAESRNDSIGIAMDIAYVEHRRDRGRDQNELNSLGSDFISRLHELHELRDKPGTIIELNPPKDFGLISCYPNPFNSTTTIKYNLTESVHVALTMHDLNGRQVAVFANEVQSAGIRSVTFQAGDLPSGLYFCRMEAGGMTDIQKLTLIR